MMTASKKGISSQQVHRQLGVSKDAAWFMCHRVRAAMKAGGLLAPMGGAGKVVMADETYYGRVEHQTDTRMDGKPMKRKASSHKNNRAVVALVERGGSVRTFHVAEANVGTVQKILRENVDRQSRLHTDASKLYKAVGKEFAEHDSVRHTLGEYVKYRDGEAIHNNACENYFSVFKRGMRGVYQHCKEKNLQRYLDEFDFRYNNRMKLGVDDKTRADRALAGSLGKRLTYRRTDRAA